MSYGVIEYNKEGLPKCEICGKHYHRVLTHVRQKHDMNEREYKKKFGLDLIKGIVSKESHIKSSTAVKKNYSKVVVNNLLKNGKSTRFSSGSTGRTKDMVSEQTRIRLIERLKTPEMQKVLRETGQKVGLSGLGNITRWKRKQTQL